MFRSIRFGVAESHGRGAALQLNTFLGSGAVTLDSVTGRYSVQLARLEQSVAGLVARLCTLQHTGDREVSVSARGRGRSSSLFVSRRWRRSWRGWAGWTRLPPLTWRGWTRCRWTSDPATPWRGRAAHSPASGGGSYLPSDEKLDH